MKWEYDGIEHNASDPNCQQCWRDYPVTCECGGLIHAHFGDYVGEEYNYYLETKCDKCGESE